MGYMDKKRKEASEATSYKFFSFLLFLISVVPLYKSYQWLDFIDNYRIQLSFISLFLMLTAPFKGQWQSFFISSLTSVINYVVIAANVAIMPSYITTNNTSKHFTISAQQVGIFYNMKQHDIKTLTSELYKLDADVVVLSDIPAVLEGTLSPDTSKYPNQYFEKSVKHGGWAILSKQSITDKGCFIIDGVCSNPWVTLDFTGQKITIVAGSVNDIPNVYFEKAADFINQHNEPVLFVDSSRYAPWVRMVRKFTNRSSLKQESGLKLTAPSFMPLYLRYTAVNFYAHPGIEITKSEIYGDKSTKTYAIKADVVLPK